MEKDLVKRAHDAFNHGDYQDAITLYQQAAYQYGQSLFDVNIRICEQRLQKPGQLMKRVPKSSDAIPVAQQLAETQELLEYYYRRCQELEYRLNDAG
ncbi:hypothetical protein [Halomonas sp. TD01]|uniref:hypothetical protein n=1 Tax=Halomonas sp. TD01 TaxID=999141 RepID=UPI000214DE7A|nr:hypothetical protein [Halomonas sp. TD01]EGP21225.1 hypothetical protein GME_02740 [Halomonas sp. TD01]CAH1043982.1 hypothetical protein HPTD01_2460 [Halomonas sp. TD01]